MTTSSESPATSIQTSIEIPRQKTSFEDYLEFYAQDSYEWVDGELIAMSPSTIEHQDLIAYLFDLLRAYFSLRAIGRVIQSPFVMKLEAVKSGREPDLLVVLNDNPSEIKRTMLLGPADICIEVVSPESTSRDYATKLQEYEKAGVKEYWLFDPLRNTAIFYRLNGDGIYHSIPLDDQQQYRTPLVPDLVIDVPTLWQQEYPDFYAIGDAVRKMLGDS